MIKIIKTLIFTIILLISANTIAQSIVIQDYTIVYNELAHKYSNIRLSILDSNKDTLATVKNADVCIKRIEEYCDCIINDNIKYQFYMLSRETYDVKQIFNINKK